MSTYYSYYLRAPLKDPSIGTVDAFREIAIKDDVYFDIESTPIHNVSATPYFGKSTEYEGPSFSFKGMDVSGGILRIGVFVSNILRAENYYEEEDGIQGPQARSRLDVLLEFLSTMTSGDPGEIQGSFGSESCAYGHGHPIIRCADGRLRVLMTVAEEETNDWAWGEDDKREIEGEMAVIPGRLPADLVDDYENGAFLNDITEKIIERLRPLDGSTQKLIG